MGYWFLNPWLIGTRFFCSPVPRIFLISSRTPPSTWPRAFRSWAPFQVVFWLFEVCLWFSRPDEGPLRPATICGPMRRSEMRTGSMLMRGRCARVVKRKLWRGRVSQMRTGSKPCRAFWLAHNHQIWLDNAVRFVTSYRPTYESSKSKFSGLYF